MKKFYTEPEAEIIELKDYISTGLTPSPGQVEETVDIGDLLDD